MGTADRLIGLLCLVVGVLFLMLGATARTPVTRTLGFIFGAVVVWGGIYYTLTIITMAGG